MTLYEEWCAGDCNRIRFNLTKHTCTKKVDFDTLDYPIIDDTTDWIRDVRLLYERYKNCIPPTGRQKINFIPANLKRVSPTVLSESYEKARVALEAYIYLHWQKGDLTWTDDRHFFVKITPDCVITRKMIIKE